VFLEDVAFEVVEEVENDAEDVGGEEDEEDQRVAPLKIADKSGNGNVLEPSSVSVSSSPFKLLRQIGQVPC